MAEPLHSETSTTDPAPSARAQASAQVLGSRTFAGSARLTSFLRFVCDETLAGRADQLNEQTIGQHVFGRPAHFNPAEDSIVRSSGRLLRQRLERYYAEEGAADTVRVVVPRGSYVPVFVDQAGRQPAQTDDGAPAPGRIADAEPSHYPRPALLRRRLLAVGAAAGMAASAGIGWRALARPASAPDPVAAMWNTLLTPDRDLLIVPADSGLVLWQAEHRQRVALADYTGTRRASEPNGSDAWSQRVQGRRYTGVVSLRLAIEVTRRAGPAASRIRMRFARDLHLNELKEANAVLIGAGNANPWSQLFEPQCVFDIDLDADERFVVTNRAPRAGEAARYLHVAAVAESPGYARIALKRNVGGSGHVLLIGGTGSAGTEAGIDFLLDPVALPRALQRLNPTGAAWDGFEILLRSQFQGHNSVGHEVLATRFWPRA